MAPRQTEVASLALDVAETLGGGQRAPPIRPRQLLQQRLSEGSTHQEVDDGVQADVERRQEERPLFDLEEQEAGIPAEVRRRHLAQRVGHAADVVGHEAEREDRQEAGDAALGPPARLAVAVAHAAVGAVHPAGDGGVAEDEQQQRGPEQAHAEEGGDAVPLHAQRRLQLHAVARVLLAGRRAGQEDVREDAEEEEAPGEQGQDPGEGHRLHQVQPGSPAHSGQTGGGRGGGGGRADDLYVALQADEAHEEDAHVHGRVEEHGRVAAHDHVQAPAAHAQLGGQPEREGGQHEEVGHHHVLQVHHQARVAGNPEEDAGGHAVEDGPRHADQDVEQREHVPREDAAEV